MSNNTPPANPSHNANGAPENRMGAAGTFYILGNAAMLAESGALNDITGMMLGSLAHGAVGAGTANVALLLGSVVGISGCVAMLVSKSFKEKKHQVLAQRVGFALNAAAAACFLLGGSGLTGHAFNAGTTALGVLGLAGNMAGWLKKEPSGQPTSNIVDIAKVRSPRQFGAWWRALPPAKAATIFYLPSGASPVMGNLLAGALPSVAQWLAGLCFTTGNLLVARSSLKTSTAPSTPQP